MYNLIGKRGEISHPFLIIYKGVNIMFIVYPVIFTATNDEKNTYLVEIPDINGIWFGRCYKDGKGLYRWLLS